MELTIAQQARGTRIISGKEANDRRDLLNNLISIAQEEGFKAVWAPKSKLSAGARIYRALVLPLDSIDSCCAGDATNVLHMICPARMAQAEASFRRLSSSSLNSQPTPPMFSSTCAGESGPIMAAEIPGRDRSHAIAT